MKHLCSILALLAFGVQAHASIAMRPTYFIPSPYKIDRGGHATGAAAAWNTQKLAGGALTIGKSKTEPDGSDAVTEDSTEITGYTYQHYAPFSFEAVLSKEKTEDDDTPEEEGDNTSVDLLGGMVLQGTPISFGLGFASGREKTEAGGTETTDKTGTIQLSVIYKPGENIYTGFALEREKLEPDGADSDDNETVYFGMGMVNEGMSFETILTYTNEEGDKDIAVDGILAKAMAENQIVGRAFFGKSEDGDDDGQTILLSGGYHIDMSTFYIQPEVGISKFEEDSAGGDISFDSIFTSAEAGMKYDAYRLYMELTLSKTDFDFGGPEGEITDTEIVLGGHAYF